ncbi:MAG: PEP-CTERM sorting domain-containing protein [Verrucomicrobia bacterium]|nr:PEP-CTERM sorting domain-containing protein [Verrucomicrobiota bacterium]MCH8526025.1 PEP-CTERM sorting domain-containing protein [Kiritimatiellia bacterium]
MKILSLFTLSFLLSFGSTASASLRVYDGFSGYTVDTTVVGQGPSTTGFSGNWTDTGGTLAATVDYRPRINNLTYTNFAPSSGGSLEAYRSSGSHSGGYKQVSRDFDYAAPGTGDFYMAFLIQNDSANAVADTRLWLQGLSAPDGNRDAFFDINHTDNTLMFSAGGGSGLETTDFGLNSGANLVVVRAIYDFGINTAGNPNAAFYDRVEFWINPTLTASAAPTSADLGTPDASGFGIMRSFNGNGTPLAYNSLHFRHSLNSGSVSLDEFTITTSLSDIVAIPEPGTLALVGIALGSLVLFRRRR